MKTRWMRAVTAALSVLMLLTMTACGTKEPSDDAADPTVATIADETTTATAAPTAAPSATETTPAASTETTAATETTVPTTTTTAADVTPTDKPVEGAVATLDNPADYVTIYTDVTRDETKNCYFNDENIPALSADGLTGTVREAYYTDDGKMVVVFMIANGSTNSHQITAFDARIFNGSGETVAAEHLSGSTAEVQAGGYGKIAVLITADNVLLKDDPLSALGVEMTFESVEIDLSNVGTVTTVTATHYATIEIADYGTIKVALDAETAPITVANFKKLADEGFYNGLTFHRIIEDFMMQGGDPMGNGMGGSDEEIVGEFATNGIDNPLSHVRGAISMARSTSKDSASSQFFIVHKDSTFLDGDYAAFGYVVEGMDVVDAVCTAAEPSDGNGTIPADKQPVITSLVVTSAS